MKSNNLTIITFDDLNKCGNVHAKVVVKKKFVPLNDRHDRHICI